MKIKDWGRKIEYARRDYYSPKYGEYRITVSSLWPKSKIRSQNKFVRYLVNLIRQDIRNLHTSNKDQAEKFVHMVTDIRDSLLDIEESDEFFRVIRKVQYAMDSNGQPLYDLDLLFGDHGISLFEMNYPAMIESGFEKSPEEMAQEEVERKLWLLRYDENIDFDEEYNRLTLEIPYEYDVVEIKIPMSLPESFLHQEFYGHFLVKWDEDKEERYVAKVNATREDYETQAAQMYKEELKRRKPSKKQSSRIQMNQTANPGVYEGPDYLKGFFPKEETFIQKFGIAGQFGNYFTQAERRKVMPKLYRSCANLALALGCSPQDLSLSVNGKSLGIALGARGHGGLRSAAAHFEPSQNVINLTKRSIKDHGGHLAHEFIHALDHWLYCRLVEEDEERFLTDLPEEEIARILPEMVEIIEVLEDSATQFRKDSLALDLLENRIPEEPYWVSPKEMFARAGSACIIKILSERNIRDDFLSFDNPEKNDWGSRITSTSPVKQELDCLTRLFKNLFAAIIQKGLWQPLVEEDLYLRAACQRGPKHPVNFGTQMSFSF